VHEKCLHGLVAARKALQNVEDQDVLRDCESKVAKPISLALHLPAVVTHGQVLQLEGVCLSIPKN
jgi:hypothetical protein